MHRARLLAIGTACFLCAGSISGQSRTGVPLNEIGHDSTLKFALRNGSCVFGSIKQFDPANVTIAKLSNPPQVIPLSQIVQASQGDAIVFSTRSSWTDVVGTPVELGESMIVTLLSGQRVQARPKNMNRDSITFRRGSGTTQLKKADIASVDYVRLKPKSDTYLYQLREMSLMAVFDPRFYSRVKLSPIRLFDAQETEDNSQLCSSH